MLSALNKSPYSPPDFFPVLSKLHLPWTIFQKLFSVLQKYYFTCEINFINTRYILSFCLYFFQQSLHIRYWTSIIPNHINFLNQLIKYQVKIKIYISKNSWVFWDEKVKRNPDIALLRHHSLCLVCSSSTEAIYWYFCQATLIFLLGLEWSKREDRRRNCWTWINS